MSGTATNTVKNKFDAQVGSFFGFTEGEYSYVTVTIIIVLYATFITRILPPDVLKLSHNWIVQLGLLAGIVYLSNKNATLGIAAALAVIITMMMATEKSEQFSENCPCPYKGQYDREQIQYDDQDNEYIDQEEVQQIKQFYQEQNNNMYHEEKKPKYVKAETNDEEIIGVVDALFEEHDDEYSGAMHSITEGAITSRGGPKMSNRQEPEYPDHRRHRKTQAEQEMIENVADHDSEDYSESSALDESGPLGYENAGSNHSETASIKSAEEAIKVAVETVTNQVERETGEEIDEEIKQEVAEETNRAVAKIAKRRPIAEFEVVSVCREIYRRKLN